jgi:ketosteroid isomerase-like protein
MGDQTVHDNIRLVLETFRAVERRDEQRLLELYHPDIEFHDASSLPYGGVVSGRPAVESHMYGPRSWAGTWTPLQPTSAERRMDPRVVAATGREVVVLYRQRAVGAGGERLDSPVLGLYEVRDGKLLRAQMFHYDTAALVGFLARADAAGH